MPRKPIDDLIDQQRGWLDPLGETLAELIRHAGEPASKVLDFLHGVWLGHPLHPAVTDVPVGAWASATIMDAVDTFFPRTAARHAADAAVGIGLAGGAMAIPAGLADWHHLKGHDRRVGLVHGILNEVVMLLFGASFFLRRTKQRPLGVSLGMLGFSIASLSAYLGGELVFNKGIGVNRTAYDNPPEGFVPVGTEAELVENQPRKFMVDGTAVMVVKQGSRIFALANTCTHLGGPLAEGQIEGDTVRCPWHGSRFALADGSVAGGPATFPEVVYDVRVRNGQVEVRARNQD